MNNLTQRKIITWTFLMVLALGAIEVKMFLIPPSTVQKAIALAHKSRLPASFGAVEAHPGDVMIDKADEILDYSLPCDRKIEPIDAGNSRQIRFHYEACPKEDYKLTSIVNETNFYEGTVFTLDDNKQTSDFIPLKEGSNHFKIILINSSNQKSTQNYVFTRAIAKTQAH